MAKEVGPNQGKYKAIRAVANGSGAAVALLAMVAFLLAGNAAAVTTSWVVALMCGLAAGHFGRPPETPEDEDASWSGVRLVGRGLGDVTGSVLLLTLVAALISNFNK